jgi:predicted nuclease of restriction endonuclease-like (RecB) superfamily
MSKAKESVIPRDYTNWLTSLKSRISSARQRATIAFNQELVRLYQHIGTEILERQTRQGWGAKVIDRLAADLRAAFPEMKGFSSSNLKYMRFFAEKCPTGLIGQQPADQLPWFHLVTLLTKVSSDTDREWYAAQAIHHGWSRPTLDVQLRQQSLSAPRKRRTFVGMEMAGLPAARSCCRKCDNCQQAHEHTPYGA